MSPELHAGVPLGGEVKHEGRQAIDVPVVSSGTHPPPTVEHSPPPSVHEGRQIEVPSPTGTQLPLPQSDAVVHGFVQIPPGNAVRQPAPVSRQSAALAQRP
jgi:hypothetical protein